MRCLLRAHIGHAHEVLVRVVLLRVRTLRQRVKRRQAALRDWCFFLADGACVSTRTEAFCLTRIDRPLSLLWIHDLGTSSSDSDGRCGLYSLVIGVLRELGVILIVWNLAEVLGNLCKWYTVGTGLHVQCILLLFVLDGRGVLGLKDLTALIDSHCWRIIINERGIVLFNCSR